VGKGLGKAGPSPAPTAAFASEEEALAAAVAVYDRFNEISDEVGQSGGHDAERLGEVLVGEFLDASVEGYRGWAEKGWRQVGATSFRDASLQQYSAGPSAAVIIYICDDVTGADVVDSGGQSIVPADRVDINYFQVTFDLAEDGRLLVAARQRWDERTC